MLCVCFEYLMDQDSYFQFEILTEFNGFYMKRHLYHKISELIMFYTPYSGNEAEWCATQVDADGEVINGQWGDCDSKSLSCLTLNAGSLGQSPVTQKQVSMNLSKI